MNSLPLHLLDEILFRLESKSLAMMRCTDKNFQTYLSYPKFGPVCPSWAKPCLFSVDNFDGCYIYRHPLVSSSNSMLPENETISCQHPCYIFGSCCGLLLLSIGALFVANPLTKKFRRLDHSGSKLLAKRVGIDSNNTLDNYFALSKSAMCVGFAVNRNQKTKRFKIVCILEMQTVYGFEISDGDFWRLSKKTITVNSKSDLTTQMKPVYLNNTLHWLRNDGSIIAINTETEQACFIPSIFHPEPEMKMLFAADEEMNLLALISGTKEEILVYTLLDNTKWTLARRIKNVYMEEIDIGGWDLSSYDGKLLVISERKEENLNLYTVIHAYDMKTNSWGVLGSICCWCFCARDFFKFTPSFFSIEEDDKKKNLILPPNDRHISSLTELMGLIDTPK